MFCHITRFKSNSLKALKSGGLCNDPTASLQSVLCLFVPPQVHFPLETFAAEVAAEWFVAGVFPAVCDEVGALAERFPTHLALVWLLT